MAPRLSPDWNLSGWIAPGLPDGTFSSQKIQIWVNFGGPGNFKSWYILWPFGIPILRPFGNLLAIWYYFHGFCLLCNEKSGNPESHKPNVTKA
jgi:hypothetical protein